MRLLKLAAALWTAGLLAVSPLSARADGAPPAVATGDFDYYVLALSWSPGFCDTGGAAKSPDQCAVGAGQGFVVHGLWPDSAYKANPGDCASPGEISTAALALTKGVYPSEGLARYEYRKHGTCTGLSPEAYFGAVRYARDQIAIPQMLKAPHDAQQLSPAEIERAFAAINANLQYDNMAVTCAKGELEDVRICISKDLRAFATCPKVAGHTCHARSISVSPLR